jgi:recombination DNA repair RAD52 pathway protein
MKWFNKWLIKKIKKAREGEYELAKEEIMPVQKSTRVESDRTMTLNITKANGGWVIEHRQYDKRTDRNNNSVHIITDDKDLGDELGKIITFESLYK